MKKKWILAIVVLLLVTVTSSLGILYTLAKKPEEAEFLRVQTLVMDQGLLTEITDMYAYNSVKSYVTVIGLTSEAEEVAYILDKEDNQTAFEVKLADGISKEQAEQLTRDEADVNEILSIKLGQEEIGPVWEVTYLNSNDALSYTYLDFKTGDWWKRISNL
ncbi:hypothetical protein MKY84_09105 [Chryseomicrobium sp. FSL W7-1435]|uniref:hypothetical protein n=1 Tax=Chryseomicrobium sp. FSL W7-1435 TaxID=2921704 RepID=UPI003159D778